MKKTIGFGVVLFLMGLALPAFAVKPRPPLNLHLTSARQPNGNMRLTLHATASMDIPDAELFVHLPESMTVVEGLQKWNGPMTAGKEKVFSLEVTPSLSGAVMAEGTVTLPQGGSFTQYATLPIENMQNKTPSLPSSSPIRRKQGEQTILEFAGE